MRLVQRPLWTKQRTKGFEPLRLKVRVLQRPPAGHLQLTMKPGKHAQPSPQATHACKQRGRAVKAPRWTSSIEYHCTVQRPPARHLTGRDPASRPGAPPKLCPSSPSLGKPSLVGNAPRHSLSLLLHRVCMHSVGPRPQATRARLSPMAASARFLASGRARGGPRSGTGGQQGQARRRHHGERLNNDNDVNDDDDEE